MHTTRLRAGMPLLAGILCITALTLAAPPARPAHASDPIALGTFLNDPQDNIIFTNDRVSMQEVHRLSDGSDIDRYTQLAGHKPAFVNVFVSFVDQWPGRLADQAQSRGVVPVITWMPANFSHPSKYSSQAVASGTYDSYIQAWAQSAKDWGHPFLLRFGHEMNGSWYPWGTGPGNKNGNTAADFVAEWKHVHDIFTSVGATNAIWVWSPSALQPKAPSIVDNYPGDAYVDWTGLDGYNHGVLFKNSHWESFTDLFGASYQQLAALSQKPIMIAEVGTVDQGGDKGAWLRSTFLNEIPTSFPRIRAVDWWNANQQYVANAHPPFEDHRVNSSAAALAAWQEIVASPLYQGNVLDVTSPATSTPPPSPAPTPSPTSAPTSAPAPTSTPPAATVQVTVRKSVRAGQRQMIRIRASAPHQTVRIRVTYPNGDHQSARLITGASGSRNYSFVQGASKTTHKRFTATVRVRLGSSTITRHYSIKLGQIDVSVEPRVQKTGRTITLWVHTASRTKVRVYLNSNSGRFVRLKGRTGSNKWVKISYRVSRQLKGQGETKVVVLARSYGRSPGYSTTTFFKVR